MKFVDELHRYDALWMSYIDMKFVYELHRYEIVSKGGNCWLG